MLTDDPDDDDPLDELLEDDDPEVDDLDDELEVVLVVTPPDVV